MSGWLQWINNRVKKFDMLGSVWFANLDHLVGNVQYLHDDSDEYQQPGESYFANKSDKSEQCHQSTSRNCTSHSNRTCNCTGSKCATNWDIGHYFGSNAVTKHFNDSVNEHNDLYAKLSGSKYYDDIGYRQSTGNSKG